MSYSRHVVEEPLPLGQDRVGAVFGHHLRSESGAETRASLWLLDQAQDLPGDGRRVLVRHEDAADAVTDLLRSATVARRDDRQARGSGFRNDVRHSLAAGQPAEYVQTAQQP